MTKVGSLFALPVGVSRSGATSETFWGGRMELTAEREFKNYNIASIVISVVAHVVVFGLIKTIHFNNSPSFALQEENYIDLGYQQFDEVPEVTSAPQPVVKNENVIQDKVDPTPAVAHEMQDQASDVAGLQKEVKQTITTATNTNTTTVPYYKVKPKYPRDALESNIEGHVLMKIDILEDGSVENIKVTGGEKLDVFESAATRAVSKWKYKAFTDEFGHAQKKRDYLVRVDFKIKDEEQLTQ